MSLPSIVFGAGGIGTTEKSFTYTWANAEQVSSLLSTLRDLDVLELDSAAFYPPGNPWNTETLLGQARAGDKGFVIDTKVAPHGEDRLDERGIASSIDRSLELLGVSKVRILYAHAPDAKTPIAETAAAFHKQYVAGKFDKLGLCNYSTEQMAEYLAVCDDKGYVKPSVYQGHYNALIRAHEESLIPLLREHGIAYFAYSPLGGGFLTGKVTFAASDDSSLSRTRWKGESAMAYYPKTYDRPEVHAALRKLHAVCEKHELPLSEVCLRWLMHHSILGRGDGIIIGATRVGQLEGNVSDCHKGRLNDELVQAVELMEKEASGKSLG